jgi:hypothetical protein
MEKKEPTEEDLQNIEDLKSKEQLEIAYAVLSGNSTAIDILSAEAIVSGQSNMPLNQTFFFCCRNSQFAYP